VQEFQEQFLEYIEPIKQFWSDPQTQAVVSKSSQFQLAHSCAYFFSRLDEICKENYLPSQEDLLRMRIKTSGIAEQSFELKDDGVTLQVVDVGGQRSERKKWLPLFDSIVDAVIVFAAISEYDQFLNEQDTVPRMEEALNLFQSIVNQKQFAKTPIVLFLNKWDLFEQKLKTKPLQEGYFKDYTGTNDPNECYEYIKKQFQSRYPEFGENLFIYQTTAIDTTGMQKVFTSIKNSIISRALQMGGMMEQTVVIQEPTNQTKTEKRGTQLNSGFLQVPKTDEKRKSRNSGFLQVPTNRPRSRSRDNSNNLSV